MRKSKFIIILFSIFLLIVSSQIAYSGYVKVQECGYKKEYYVGTKVVCESVHVGYKYCTRTDYKRFSALERYTYRCYVFGFIPKTCSGTRTKVWYVPYTVSYVCGNRYETRCKSVPDVKSTWIWKCWDKWVWVEDKITEVCDPNTCSGCQRCNSRGTGTYLDNTCPGCTQPVCSPGSCSGCHECNSAGSAYSNYNPNKCCPQKNEEERRTERDNPPPTPSTPSTPSAPACSPSCNYPECASTVGNGCGGTCTRDSQDDKRCNSNNGVCMGGSCVDCDSTAEACVKCGGFLINNQCCGDGSGEYSKDLRNQFGGLACCSQQNQCAIADNSCVNNLESDYTNDKMINDSICLNGNLMSRTKFVALQLLNITNNKDVTNYVLFCDEKEDTLNKIYGKDETEIKNVINTCVLSLKDANRKDQQIIIGAVLKPNNNLFELINTSTVCDDVEDKNEFQSCNGKIYYNPKAYTVIFSTKEITNVMTPTFTVAIKEFFTNLINRFLNTTIGQNPDISYVTQKDERYTNLYLNRIGDRFIRAVKEPRVKDTQDVEVIIADYEGFEGDICTGETREAMERHKGKHYKRFGVEEENYNCTKTDEGYQMFFQNQTFSDKWVDITAKLRPK